MHKLTIRSRAAQVAEYLHEELLRRTWCGEMPGTPRLAAELGIDHRVVIGALRLLEEEGLLVDQGTGRPRRIELPKSAAPPSLRVAIMKQGSLDHGPVLVQLRHLIEEAGHSVFEANKSLLEFGMDPKRIARYVNRTAADAWVVIAGSREVLEMFATRPVPAFALLGQWTGVPIAAAGPLTTSALSSATHRLIELGHRRISLLVRKHHRRPSPSRSVRSFLEGLEAVGITHGAFNLPDWEESADGLRVRLDALFQHTPPTALIANESFLFNAVFHHLADRGRRVPRDVSLICIEVDPNHVWCRPSVAHIRWDYQPALRRAVGWALNVARGKDDREQSEIPAEFVEGGTVGTVSAGR